MKTLINIDQWIRKDHYLFFSQFEEPFFGVTINIDCTKAYRDAKQKENSFFLHYLYRALKAANEIENFRYRIIDKQVYLFEQINASPTINRPNGTFGFSYMDYNAEEQLFYKKALEEIELVQKSTGLIPAVSGENVIHFSAIPWVNFTALSHARSFSFPDSAPKISFGKLTEINGVKTMPVSIHVHHGLMDGYHVGLFADKYQELMNEI
ncbi:CatA-like O-acetyltransferase [Chitinophagaceae bacterium LWZ2-11]